MATLKKTEDRVNFSSTKSFYDYPDFLEIQLASFREFFQLETNPENRSNEGLFKVFAENFPITDTRNQFVLEFLDYFIDPPRYTIDECIERGLTYSVPLKAKLKLYCTDPEHEDFETIVQDVYLGTIPYMTPQGSFVINGAERVIVSQLHRSPGVFFGQSRHAEMDAIIKLLDKYDGLSSLAGASLYVTRITNTNKTSMAKPCPRCMELIQSVGIKQIIFTTHTGVERIKL